MINTPTAQRTTPRRRNPVDTMKRQYGAVLAYGSVLESARGTVIQSAETAVSNRPFYENLKSRHQ